MSKKVVLQFLVLLALTSVAAFAQYGGSNPLTRAANGVASAIYDVGAIAVGALVVWGALSVLGSGARGIVATVGTIIGVVFVILKHNDIVNWVQSW